ncbi:RNA pseudouridine synthase [Kocuria flava]|uniref:Pseudouridine synthase n=1 Tax=Kocuria flava TaxID=446860 RepID=A0A0U3I935_9MICC|nr:RluA family pseudouridine synthase [Kocuria flava]ALU39868.1 RNA pseudouridine synthase [Kocuria flava]GEO91958.1 pseudouridine synthase [Kocuria flava]
MAEPAHTEERFTVPAELEGARADAAVAALTGLSRTVAAELCAQGRVLHRGRALTKSARVEASQTLVVHVPVPEDPGAVVPQLVEDFRVVHLDDDIVVVDKPPGVAAHPSPGWRGPTVVGALAGAGIAITTSGAPERQGIVHRLDVGTSGLMVVARTERAYTLLKRAFKERTVTKVYHTVVQGLPDPLRGTVDAPVGRHPGYEWRFAVVEDGRRAVTHYEVLEAFGRAALVEVHLETGRTHQIRVHFAALRHPCCGDLTYGADPALSAGLGLTRQWLHARRLGFEHPGTGEPVEYESPYPPDLAFALETLRDGGPA